MQENVCVPALYVSAFEEYCKHPSLVLKQMPLPEGVHLKEMTVRFKLNESCKICTGFFIHF